MDWKNNKWVWIIVGITIFNVVLFGMSELIVRRTTNKVIERLQKEYSPSPYGPGIDPDKVNPDLFRKKFEVRFDEQPTQTEDKNHSRNQIPAEKSKEKKVEEATPQKTDWIDSWEKQRRE